LQGRSHPPRLPQARYTPGLSISKLDDKNTLFWVTLKCKKLKIRSSPATSRRTADVDQEEVARLGEIIIGPWVFLFNSQETVSLRRCKVVTRNRSGDR
jgi:hypothetical protein